MVTAPARHRACPPAAALTTALRLPPCGISGSPSLP